MRGMGGQEKYVLGRTGLNTVWLGGNSEVL